MFASKAMPNPSFEARPNIKTLAPRGGAGYYPPRGASVLLSVSASIQTLGCTKTARQACSASPAVRHTESGCVPASNTKTKCKAKEAFPSKFRARQFRHFGCPRTACRLTIRSSGRANGVPPGPGRQYGVHFRRPGPGVTPSSSP
jgi:hypothetical protein